MTGAAFVVFMGAKGEIYIAALMGFFVYLNIQHWRAARAHPPDQE